MLRRESGLEPSSQGVGGARRDCRSRRSGGRCEPTAAWVHLFRGQSACVCRRHHLQQRMPGGIPTPEPENFMVRVHLQRQTRPVGSWPTAGVGGTTSSWNNASSKILRRLRTKLRFMRDAAGESRHSICNEWICSGLCDQCLLSQTVDFSAIYLRRS